MIVAYICSPYRAADKKQRKQYDEYVKRLTKMAIDSGIAPIAPHMYITHVLDDGNKEDRAAGLAAGINLLYKCDVLIYGDKYGISEGMHGEMREAEANGIPRVSAESCTSVDDFIKTVQRAVRGDRTLWGFKRSGGMSMFRTYPSCGANLDHGERCTCGGIETATPKTPRELVVDSIAAMEQAKAREKQIAQATLRKGIYTAICKKTTRQ